MAYRLLNRIGSTPAGSVISSPTQYANLRRLGGILVADSVFWADAVKKAKGYSTLRQTPDATEYGLLRQFITTLVEGSGVGGANELRPTTGDELDDMLAFACRPESTQKTIRLPFATALTLNRPLNMATAGAFCFGVQILGSSPIGATGHAYNSRLVCDFDDGPAINIQGGRGCVLEDVEVIGQNNYKDTIVFPDDFLNDEAAFTVGSVRTNRYSPHAGITFDALQSTSPDGSDANCYPSFLERGLYTSDFHRASASGNYLTRVSVLNFDSGIINSPGSVLLGGDNWILTGCYFTGCKNAFSTCQGQTKSNLLRDCHCTYAWNYINNNIYGQQAGFPPTIDGGDCGASRRLAYLIANWGPILFKGGFFTETLIQLGIFGVGEPSTRELATFEDCNIDIYEPTTTRAVDAHAVVRMPMTFRGGRLVDNNALRNVLRMHNGLGIPITFDNTKIHYRDWDGQGPPISFHDDSVVEMRNAQFLNTTDGQYFKNQQPLDTSVDTVLGSVTLSASGVQGATFTLVGHGRVQGDMLFATNLGDSYVPEEIVGNLSNCAIGIVESVAGNDVTVGRIPKSLTLPKTLSVTAKRYLSA